MLRPRHVLLLPLVVCLIDMPPLTSDLQTALILVIVVLGGGALALQIWRLKAAERQLTLRVIEISDELAEANKRLELQATTDGLTRLANRQRFSEFLEQEWARAVRGRASIGLLVVDVDYFKRYNETHGRVAGDQGLRRVAEVIGARVKRPSDLAARYGGEKFAVVLAGAEEPGALSVADWIRSEIEKQRIPHGASTVSDYVTVSIGVAAASPLAGGWPERLMADADAALKRAKALGRNAVIASSSATRARETAALE